MQFVALDFRRVTGLDSTALLSFRKLKQVAATHQITLVLTEVGTAVHQQLISGGLDDGDGRIRFFPNLDQGVEWNDAPAPLSQQLARLLPEGVE